MKNFKKCGYSSMNNFKKMWLFMYQNFQIKCGYSCMTNFKKCGYSSMKNFKKMWLFQYEKFQKNVVILV